MHLNVTWYNFALLRPARFSKFHHEIFYEYEYFPTSRKFNDKLKFGGAVTPGGSCTMPQRHWLTLLLYFKVIYLFIFR